MKLQGKVALITGGAGGIGLATAKLFIEEGAKVVITDIDKDAIDKALVELPESSAIGLVADVCSAVDQENAVTTCVSKFGQLDILFANAGYEGIVEPLEAMDESTFDRVININVKGVWLGLKYAFKVMKENGGGNVIITSSVAGLKGTPNVLAYTTSKHATIGLMRSAALEGAPHNIRVNSMHPSPVDNRMMRSLEEGFAPGAGAEAKKGFEQSIPMKRYATNEECAKMALFLASDDSSFSTGGIFTIDGGMSA
ncbi:MAG: SDR family oxidoreductase [Schleiferiaceae bacterium]|nr:SDR family oxidoreductase [Schleiferiaceae bacterium]